LATALLACSSAARTTADSGFFRDFDASHRDVAVHDGGSTKRADAAGSRDAAILRTATTRPLLPTSVDSVLYDPFVTSDEDWGHFRAVIPATGPDASVQVCGALNRQFLSASPIGVAAPTLVATAALGCTEILAPFSGGSGPNTFHAKVWISVASSSGVPVPLPSSLDSTVTVALLPNVLPSAPAAAAYPLTLEAGSAVTLADGSEWALLSLAAPVSLPMGGWFAIQIVTPTGTIRLAGPEVVPTTTVSLVHPIDRPIRDAERAAIGVYARLAHEHPARR